MTQDTVAIIGAIGNIATAFGVLVATGGLAFVWLQTRHNYQAREASICLTLAQYSNSKEFSESLLKAVAANTIKNPSAIDTDSALRVCVFFELVGSICNHGYMSSKLIEEFYGYVIRDAYAGLEGFIAAHRTQTGRALFCANFEKLARSVR